MARPARRLPIHSAFRAPPHPALDYRPPRALRLARRATYTFIGLSSAAILYVIWWVVLSLVLKDAAQTWIDDRRADGLTITMEKIEVDGFPFTLRLSLSQPVFSHPDGWGWSAPFLIIERPPVPFSTMTASTLGEQSLSVASAEGPRRYVGTVEHIAVSIDDLTAFPGRIEVTAKTANLSDSDGNTVSLGQGRMRLEVSSPPSGSKRPSASLSVTVQDLALPTPPPSALPLGPRVQSLALTARLLGRLSGFPPQAGAVAAWRDAGGTVEIDALVAHYGPLHLNASGTLALDGTMQPVGAATAKVRGFFDTIDKLRIAGTVKPESAMAAKLILGALSHRAADGGSVLNVPMSLQNQTLHLGPVPLLTLPALSWPDDATPEKET